MHQEKLKFSPRGIENTVYDPTRGQFNKLYLNKKGSLNFSLSRNSFITQTFDFVQPEYLIRFNYSGNIMDSIHVCRIVNRNIFSHIYNCELLTVLSNDDLEKYGTNAMCTTICPDIDHIVQDENIKRLFISFLVGTIDYFESEEFFINN